MFRGVRRGIVDMVLTSLGGLHLLLPEIVNQIDLPLAIQSNGFALLNGKQNSTFNE